MTRRRSHWTEVLADERLQTLAPYRVGIELKDDISQRQEHLEHGLLGIDLSLYMLLNQCATMSKPT
jgi:hypothetical protein